MINCSDFRTSDIQPTMILIKQKIYKNAWQYYYLHVHFFSINFKNILENKVFKWINLTRRTSLSFSLASAAAATCPFDFPVKRFGGFSGRFFVAVANKPCKRSMQLRTANSCWSVNKPESLNIKGFFLCCFTNIIKLTALTINKKHKKINCFDK